MISCDVMLSLTCIAYDMLFFMSAFTLLHLSWSVMYYVLQSCTMLVSHVVVMLAIAVSHQRTSLTVSLHGGCDWPDPVLDMIGFGLYIHSLFLSAPRAAGSRLRAAAHRLRKLCDPSALVPLRRAPVALHTVYRRTCLFNAYQVFFIKTSCSHDGFAQPGQGSFFLHLSLSLSHILRLWIYTTHWF